MHLLLRKLSFVSSYCITSIPKITYAEMCDVRGPLFRACAATASDSQRQAGVLLQHRRNVHLVGNEGKCEVVKLLIAE